MLQNKAVCVAKRMCRVVALLLVASVLAACTGLLLRNADWLLIRYVSEYMTLDDVQKDLIRDELAASIQRMDANSVTRLLGLLTQAQELNRKQLLAPEIPVLVASIETLGEEFQRDALPGLLALAATVSIEQRQEIQDELNSRNRKFTKEYLEPGLDKRRRAVGKEIRANAKRWLGRLNEEQALLIKDFIARYDVDEQPWYDSRLALQRAMLTALEESELSRRMAALEQLAEEPDHYYSVEYTRQWEANKRLTQILLQDLLRSCTASQRERIDREFIRLKGRITNVRDALRQVGATQLSESGHASALCKQASPEGLQIFDERYQVARCALQSAMMPPT